MLISKYVYLIIMLRALSTTLSEPPSRGNQVLGGNILVLSRKSPWSTSHKTTPKHHWSAFPCIQSCFVNKHADGVYEHFSLIWPPHTISAVARTTLWILCAAFCETLSRRVTLLQCVPTACGFIKAFHDKRVVSASRAYQPMDSKAKSDRNTSFEKLSACLRV